MEIVSCNSCGVVLDKYKLDFPCIYLPDGTVNQDAARWDDEEEAYVSIVDCPVCGCEITTSEVI